MPSQIIDMTRTPKFRITLSITAMLFALTGCGPAPESSSAAGPGASRDALQSVQSSDRPEITADRIMSDIVGRVVRVAELTEAGPATDWTFEAGEFRHVDILEKHLAENKLTLVIFMTTRNNPQPNEDNVQVSGRLRLHYERKGSRWGLTTIENLSFRYSLGLSA